MWYPSVRTMLFGLVRVEPQAHLEVVAGNNALPSYCLGERCVRSRSATRGTGALK